VRRDAVSHGCRGGAGLDSTSPIFRLTPTVATVSRLPSSEPSVLRLKLIVEVV
jgi:hypothetical protein